MSTVAPSKTAWTLAREMYRGLPTPARVAAAFAVGAALLAAIYFGSQSTEPDSVYLLGGQQFSETQLHVLCRALETEGLTGGQIDGSRLRVPRAQVAQYVAALAKRDALPASFYTAFDRAAEQTSWWSSSVQDDRRWELARQKSLAQIIEQMPEVEAASVLIDRTVPRGLRHQSETRATVTVKPRSGFELPTYRIRQIRNLMVGAVAGLPAENVAVVDLAGRALVEFGSNGNTTDDLLTRVKEFEEHYARKIRSVLAYLPDAMVTVNVELDTTRQRRTEEVSPAIPDAKPAVEPAADSPRVTANAAIELPADDAPAPSELATTQKHTWEEHVALAPKSITVGVAIPQDVVASLSSRSHGSAATTAWKKRVEELVAGAIPAGISPQINVNSYPRELERSAGGTLGSATRADHRWLPWMMAGGASIVVLALAAILFRVVPQTRARSATMRSEYSQTDSISDASHRRELVRVERGTKRSRGPHLMQVSISHFEDLRRLAPRSLQAVLGEVEARLWAPALRGASRGLCERVLAHLPTQAAALLRSEIEYPGPVRLGDVEAAQQEILEVVRRLDHTGDLMLEDRQEVARD